MNNIRSTTYRLAGELANKLKFGFHKGCEWTSHMVKIIQTIPHHMQTNKNVAIAVFATANTISFSISNFILNRMDQRLDNPTNPLTTGKRIFKNILLNVLIPAGSTAALNIGLSKLTHYSLTRSTVIAITTTAVATRILLSQLCKVKLNKFSKEKVIEKKDSEEKPQEKVIEKIDSEEKPEDTKKNQIEINGQATPNLNPFITLSRGWRSINKSTLINKTPINHLQYTSNVTENVTQEKTEKQEEKNKAEENYSGSLE